MQVAEIQLEVTEIMAGISDAIKAIRHKLASKPLGQTNPASDIVEVNLQDSMQQESEAIFKSTSSKQKEEEKGTSSVEIVLKERDF